MMTFDQAIAERNRAEKVRREAGEVMRSLKGAAGFAAMAWTPDVVKASDAYQTAKRDADRAFADLRRVNAFLSETYPNELRASRRR